MMVLIILLQTSAETVEVLPDLLHYLQATGQTIELLSEMMYGGDRL